MTQIALPIAPEPPPGRPKAVSAPSGGSAPGAAGQRSSPVRVRTTEAPAVRWLLTGLALGFMLLFLVLPLAAVFVEALRGGWSAYWAALREPDAGAAIRLTLLTAAITVPLNLAGLPGLSIPAGLGPESKLPVGVQLIGPAFSEDKILQAGHALSQALGMPAMPSL